MPRSQKSATTRSGLLFKEGIGTHFATPKKSRRGTRYSKFYKTLAHDQRLQELEAELHSGLDAINWMDEDRADDIATAPRMSENADQLYHDSALPEDDREVHVRETGLDQDVRQQGGNVGIDVSAHHRPHQHDHHISDWVATQARYRQPRRVGPSAEAETLYNHWRCLIPKLIHPLLEYEQRTTGHQAITDSDIDWRPPHCSDMHCEKSTSVVTCLFWDRKCAQYLRILYTGRTLLGCRFLRFRCHHMPVHAITRISCVSRSVPDIANRPTRRRINRAARIL